jgi:hypothetical protein
VSEYGRHGSHRCYRAGFRASSRPLDGDEPVPTIGCGNCRFGFRELRGDTTQNNELPPTARWEFGREILRIPVSTDTSFHRMSDARLGLAPTLR